mmetsp:Transcript_5782/g.11876  ORF Transcript_5782/g.11876 Transcript_5782/m.11876 type:complete len:113 (+) Transcript_5782:843-1181(+)
MPRSDYVQDDTVLCLLACLLACPPVRLHACPSLSRDLCQRSPRFGFAAATGEILISSAVLPLPSLSPTDFCFLLSFAAAVWNSLRLLLHLSLQALRTSPRQSITQSLNQSST